MPLVQLLMEDIAEHTKMAAARRAKLAAHRVLYFSDSREQTVSQKCTAPYSIKGIIQSVLSHSAITVTDICLHYLEG